PPTLCSLFPYTPLFRSDILQRAKDPRVAPRGILLGHAHHQTPDLREHARTTAPSLRVRPFPRDELPMPAANRVGRDDRGDVTIVDRKSTRLNSSHQIIS